jgi:hypothetical protein
LDSLDDLGMGMFVVGGSFGKSLADFLSFFLGFFESGFDVDVILMTDNDRVVEVGFAEIYVGVLGLENGFSVQGFVDGLVVDGFRWEGSISYW